MALSTLTQMDKTSIERFKKHTEEHTRARHGHKKGKAADRLQDNHSLQASSGKSHPIC